jgi:hypothetical protein
VIEEVVTMHACIRRCARPIARLALLGALLATAAFASGSASAQTVILPTIYVNYGWTCAFSIVSDANTPVTTIPPGTYQIEVSTPEPFGNVDQTAATNYYGCDGAIAFELSGPSGVMWTTSLSGGDDDTDLTTVTLVPNETYNLVDNNDPAAASATITTQASGAPTNPSTTQGSGESTSLGSSPSQAPSSTLPNRGSLSATVGPHGAVALTFRGRRVGVLKSGRYRVTVINRSRTGGFILQQLNEPYKLLLRIGVLGTHTMTVALVPGQWLFSPRFTGRKGWFTVIS